MKKKEYNEDNIEEKNKENIEEVNGENIVKENREKNEEKEDINKIEDLKKKTESMKLNQLQQ